MTPSEIIGRADDAKAELKLTAEAFAAIREDCLTKMLALSRKGPVDPEAIRVLAAQVNLADDVEATLRAHIAAGKVAEDEMGRTRKAESMSPTQRRYADKLGKP